MTMPRSRSFSLLMRATSSLVEPVDFNSSRCRALSSSCLRNSVMVVADLSFWSRVVASWVWSEANSVCIPATSSFFLAASWVNCAMDDSALVSFSLSAPFSVWRVSIFWFASLAASALARASSRSFAALPLRVSLSLNFAARSSRSFAAARLSDSAWARAFLRSAIWARISLRLSFAAWPLLACASFRRASSLSTCAWRSSRSALVCSIPLLRDLHARGGGMKLELHVFLLPERVLLVLQRRVARFQGLLQLLLGFG